MCRRYANAPPGAKAVAQAIGSRSYRFGQRVILGYGGRCTKCRKELKGSSDDDRNRTCGVCGEQFLVGLAEEAGISRSTAVRAIKWLVDNQLVERRRGGGRRGAANQYTAGLVLVPHDLDPERRTELYYKHIEVAHGGQPCNANECRSFQQMLRLNQGRDP
jgi:hypothetical protein